MQNGIISIVHVCNADEIVNIFDLKILYVNLVQQSC